MAYKDREKEKACAARSRARNKAQTKARNAAYYAANAERLKRPASYYRDWRAKNPKAAKAIVSAYAAKNPEAKRARVRKRRAKQMQAAGIHTAAEIAALFLQQDGKCANQFCLACIAGNYHADHIMPLALGGDNWITNIQLLCPRCNHQKGAKHPDVWLEELRRENP